MNNFETAEKVLAATAESSGSALAENEKYLDSIQGKVGQLQASAEALSSSVVSTDMIKGIVDAGTTLLNRLNWIVEKVGGLGVAMGAVPFVQFIKNTKLGGDAFNALKATIKDFAGGNEMTFLGIRPPYRDGNIERADLSVRRYEGNDSELLCSGKWCA